MNLQKMFEMQNSDLNGSKSKRLTWTKTPSIISGSRRGIDGYSKNPIGGNQSNQ
ncbi:hypothetical protein EFW58_00649 [Bacillus velezensis]|nr:hypothetical protein EFW58_00649 [Bacillus velezensis]